MYIYIYIYIYDHTAYTYYCQLPIKEMCIITLMKILYHFLSFPKN